MISMAAMSFLFAAARMPMALRIAALQGIAGEIEGDSPGYCLKDSSPTLEIYKVSDACDGPQSKTVEN